MHRFLLILQDKQKHSISMLETHVPSFWNAANGRITIAVPHFPLNLLLASQVEQEAPSSVFLMTALDSEIYEMLTKERQFKALFISAGDLLEQSQSEIKCDFKVCFLFIFGTS